MASAYDKLRRMLLLEKEQGYRNRAVIGGFGRFVAYWEKEARGEIPSERWHEIVEVVGVLGAYAELPAEHRPAAVDHLLELLSADVPEVPATPPPPPAPAKEPPPAAEPVAKPPEEPSPEPAPRPTEHRAPRVSAKAQEEGRGLDSPVTVLRGVSEVSQRRLARLGIETVEDLLYHLPRRYDDYARLARISELALGDEVTIVGVIQRVSERRSQAGKSVLRVTVSDGTAPIEATWFNQPFLAQRFQVGREIVLSGRVDEYLGRLVFTSPEWEPLQRQLLHTGRLVPVYPLTAQIGGRWLRRLTSSALDAWAHRVKDPLSAAMRQAYDLMDLGAALQQLHFPDDWNALERARRRLCFDEFLVLQLSVLRYRARWRAQRGRVLSIPEDEIAQYIAGLPFELTGAQQRAIREILADLGSPVAMSRLLQGDVGSGKTVVAIVAALAVVRNGLQAAIMAPTAILAEQHCRTIRGMLPEDLGIRVVLLIGDLPASEKRAAQEEIASGRAQIAVGTHALIQDAVDYARLGLVVIDEQHRFGVAQRGALRAKAGDLQPHMLAMSATPIPRTLMLTLYGDLDVSMLDELPPGRQRIVTAVRTQRSRERVYSFVRAQLEEGRQAFIICPLVEESENIEATAAIAEHERLQREVFPDYRIGLLHGRMSAEEKDRVMSAFSRGEYRILVSTAVVEVGIDVPNATVILIEGAERFGLAQLHQFRGRVGRGEFKSYCVLLSDDTDEQRIERLRIMEETDDGFVLAEKDLELRGPGDFFGLRQHGLPPLRVAKLSDRSVLELARRAATELYEDDPELAKTEHQLLRERVARFWRPAELS